VITLPFLELRNPLLIRYKLPFLRENRSSKESLIFICRFQIAYEPTHPSIQFRAGLRLSVGGGTIILAFLEVSNSPKYPKPLGEFVKHFTVVENFHSEFAVS
jgi:hypothetical protein